MFNYKKVILCYPANMTEEEYQRIIEKSKEDSTTLFLTIKKKAEKTIITEDNTIIVLPIIPEYYNIYENCNPDSIPFEYFYKESDGKIVSENCKFIIEYQNSMGEFVWLLR